MKTLYISDLDGTLLNSKASLSDDTRETINRLVEQGMFFTYATARSAISSKNVTEGLNLKLPIIIYNGTFIMDGGIEVPYIENTKKKQDPKIKVVEDENPEVLPMEATLDAEGIDDITEEFKFEL